MNTTNMPKKYYTTHMKKIDKLQKIIAERKNKLISYEDILKNSVHYFKNRDDETFAVYQIQMLCVGIEEEILRDEQKYAELILNA